MHAFTDLLAGIEARSAHMEARLIQWANLNSGSHNTPGLLQMGSWLADELRELGARVHLVPLPDADAPAVVARKRPGQPRRVLLSGHFDTVYPETDPFQECAVVADDVLRGPGVADMKGGLVVMLETLRALESCDAGRGLGWQVVLTPDEELGSPASAPLLREAAAENQLAIVFEPALSDGSIIGSRKGSGVVRARARGRAAHAGRDFGAGRNAIVALAHFVSAASFLNQALADVVVNAGTISGGGPVNIVPDRAEAQFNVRALRVADGEELLRRMRDAAASIGRANGVEITLEGGFGRTPMEPTAQARALLESWCAAAGELGVSLTSGHSGGSSDGNLLSAAGLPCIDGAGVEGGDLHSPGEWMRPSSLARRTRIAALFLARLASSEIDLPPPPAG